MYNYTLASKDPKQLGFRGSLRPLTELGAYRLGAYRLGAYRLGAYRLGRPIWDLADHSLNWGLQAGGLQAGAYMLGVYRLATDFGSGGALACA